MWKRIKMEIKEEPLESIIKIEAQEFETIVDERLLVELRPSYLKAADNDFFQPIVLLERIEISKEDKLKKPKFKKTKSSAAEPAKKLKQHQKWHYCTECTEKFDVKANFRSHFLKTHFKGKLFECHCGSIFREKCNLTGHERLYHSQEPSSCRICKQTFKRRDQLCNHWRRYHFTEHGPMTQNGYRKKRNGAKIIRRLHHHGRYTCDKCGTEVSCYASMRAHWEKHLRAGMLQCDLCPRTYHHKCYLNNHMRIVHVKEKKFKCKKCNFSAITARWLNEHMETYHNERQECPVCKKMVRVMSRHLKRHRIIPQCEIERVACPVCKFLVRKKNLKKHVREVHENLKKCNQCDEAFSSRDLRIHKLRAHFDGELFECHCGNVFKSDCDLITHQKNHLTLDIDCKVCNKNYSKLSSYNWHWKTRHASTHGYKIWKMKDIQADK